MVNSFNKVFMGAAGTPTGASDDQFNRVSFMSHFEGANNGVNNAFDDGSASNHTITANGNVTQGSFGPFARPDGEFAVHFDGEGFYHCAADADFAFGTGDFCMEAWVFVEADAYNYSRVFCFGPYYSNNDSHGLLVNGTDNNDKIVYYDYRNSQFRLVSTTVTPINEWFHIAVTKASNVMRLFYNGQIEATATNTGAPEASSTNTVAIGNAPDAGSGGEDFQGFISNARVVKGSAVYTANFTPSTSKLTAITNTKLLTCQSNRFVDNSAEAHAITIGGAAGAIQVSAFGPFLTSSVYDPAVNGASAYLDGSGDYLSVADSTDFNVASGADWTLEFWGYYTNVSANNQIVDTRPSGSNGFYFTAAVDTNKKVYFFTNSGYVLTTAASININEWVHIAFVRSSGTLKIYINGTADSNTYSDSNTYISGNWWIGTRQSSAGSWTYGSMSNFRFVNGTAVYTSNFTPPTAPLTAITNTKLLLNMADGQAIDSAAQNNLTLAGNANTSTDQAKFGTASLHLDGTGDYVTLTGSHAFGTGDYTIEMFVYHTSISGQQTYFSDAYADTAGVYLYKDSNHKLGLYYSGQIVTGSDNVPANQWVHVSVCRASGTSRLFLDGVLQGSASDTTNLTQTAYSIGDSVGTSSGEFIGYIDDIRVSKMARYTSAFTAPSEPFADKGQ